MGWKDRPGTSIVNIEAKLSLIEAKVSMVTDALYKVLSSGQLDKINTELSALRDVVEELRGKVDFPYHDIMPQEIIYNDDSGFSLDDQQFYPSVIPASGGGDPSVKVKDGNFLTPYGSKTVGSDSEVTVTSSGWIIARATKAASGAVSILYSPSSANPANATYYEANICKVTYTSGSVTISMVSFGEKIFIPAI